MQSKNILKTGLLLCLCPTIAAIVVIVIPRIVSYHSLRHVTVADVTAGTTGEIVGAKSAIGLALLFLKRERPTLEKITEALGKNPKPQEIDLCWRELHRSMVAMGATTEEADGVLKGVGRAKHTTMISHDNAFGNPARMWPVLVRRGQVQHNPVWVVYVTYWHPLFIGCGNTTAEEVRRIRLAYRVHVVSAKAPYQSWIAPLALQRLRPDERSPYISNDFLNSEEFRKYY